MKLKEMLSGFLSLPTERRILAVFLLVSVAGALVLFGLVAARPEFGVLYTNLSEEDAAKVLSKLQEMKKPYRILPGGRGVEVHQDQVYELRLLLASAGVTGGGTLGYELFDKDNWKTSRFVEGINYRRALQGELARTIMSLDEVERARIHLVLPERTPFVAAEQSRPKASVVLKLRGGRSLDGARVQGIVSLVSSSVEGLLAENVSVVDTEGRLLTSGGGPVNDAGVMPAHQFEYKRALETNLEQQVGPMLEKLVGRGNAIVRVSAELDFRQVEQEEEQFDPDSVVIRSEQKRAEKMSLAGAGGIPGIGANVPGGSEGAGTGASPSEKKEQVLNYEINRVVKRMVESPGAVQRLSVAVLIRETGQVSPQALQEVTSLVKSAVGFNADRGDQVEVSLLPFDISMTEAVPPEDVSEENVAMETVERLLPYALKYLGLALGALVLVLLVLRPLLRNLGQDGRRWERFQQQVTERLGEPAAALPEESGKDKLLRVIREDPSRAAQVMRLWLREG